MQKLIKGLRRFEKVIFNSKKGLFNKLKEGQVPEVLFITCSDSRVDPSLITQTNPGDLFILRNAGNIIPPYDGENAFGESATIEFALDVLKIKDIIVCGHTRCGAIDALLHPELVTQHKCIQGWLKHSHKTKQIMHEHYAHLQGLELLTAAIEENVLTQIEHLKTYPFVAKRLEAGDLRIHAWVYKFEEGKVFGHDESSGQFIPYLENIKRWETREKEI